MRKITVFVILMAFILLSDECHGSSGRFLTLTNQTQILYEDTIHIVYPVDDMSLALSQEEERMLLKIGMAEAGIESIECIANVMRVVLNRVESPEFPDSIDEVLYQQNQFTPVLYGTYETAEPNEKCYEALKLIESGWDNSQGALYFETFEDPDNWHSRNFTFLFKLGTTRFYK